jgi:hypothetical protein
MPRAEYLPGMAHGQHSSLSAEWWTPGEIVDTARALWGLDLDPASCPEANRIVQAKDIFTRVDDGLFQRWKANTVWCNPPSGEDEDSSASQWWAYASKQWACGNIGRLWFVVFNPSSFYVAACNAAARAGVPNPHQAIRIELLGRVRYLRAGATPDLFGGPQVERGKSPPHGSALLLLTDRREDVARVASAYAHLGETLVP